MRERYLAWFRRSILALPFTLVSVAADLRPTDATASASWVGTANLALAGITVVILWLPFWLERSILNADSTDSPAPILARLPLLGSCLYVAPPVYALVLVTLGLPFGFMWAYASVSTMALLLWEWRCTKHAA